MLKLEANVIALPNGYYYEIIFYKSKFKIFKKNIFILHFYTKDEAQNAFENISDMINNNRITYNDIKEVTKNNNGFMKFFLFQR